VFRCNSKSNRIIILLLSDLEGGGMLVRGVDFRVYLLNGMRNRMRYSEETVRESVAHGE
jgi:hypothetical protein